MSQIQCPSKNLPKRYVNYYPAPGLLTAKRSKGEPNLNEKLQIYKKVIDQRDQDMHDMHDMQKLREMEIERAQMEELSFGTTRGKKPGGIEFEQTRNTNLKGSTTGSKKNNKGVPSLKLNFGPTDIAQESTHRYGEEYAETGTLNQSDVYLKNPFMKKYDSK